MLKTKFKKEDQRKDALFAELNLYIDNSRDQLLLAIKKPEIVFDQYVEDLVVISKSMDGYIKLYDEGQQKIAHLHVGKKIAGLFRADDMAYIEMGFAKNKWWLLEVVSIGSCLKGNFKSGEVPFHLSLNPAITESQAHQ